MTYRQMYVFIINKGCCDKCDAIAGKHFYVKDMIPGENAPPIHPNCRCSTAPYSDRQEFEDWLDFVSNGGTTEQWDMKEKAYRAKRIKDEKEYTYDSKSDILYMQSIEDIEVYFSNKYSIDVTELKGGRRTLEGIKVLLAGVDDFLSLYPEVGRNIKKITFGVVNGGSGAYNNVRKTMTVNNNGIGSYVTGYHEAVHAFDDFMSLTSDYDFSESLYEKARKKLKYRKNSKILEMSKIEIVGFSNYREVKKTYELLAYSFEHEINGSKVNDLSELLVCLAKEKYNERFKK